MHTVVNIVYIFFTFLCLLTTIDVKGMVSVMFTSCAHFMQENIFIYIEGCAKFY